MKTAELKAAVLGGAFDERFTYIYGAEALETQKQRYAAAIDAFAALYGRDRDAALYSVAGRSELSGNHTDHNFGRVIAASINLDIIAVAAPNEENVIRVKSEGFAEDVVDINVFTEPKNPCLGHSDELIAGMVAGFRKEGHCVGGFDAYTTSNVLKGSGISSSAAFEDMIGTILSHLYNKGEVDEVSFSKISQYAENQFFGKPCGLMDQVACAVGGIVAIDFADPTAPVIEALPFDMTAAGYHLCIVNTGGNHADLTDDYAAVPAEMKAVAAHFGQSVLREVTTEQVIAAIPALREKVGDRAVLRALHFLSENDRVAAQKAALQAAIAADDVATRDAAVDKYFEGVLSSGRSSFCYLQNVYTTKNVTEQGLSLALCLCDSFFAGGKGAFRVHGGGFAGTIQAYVPAEKVEAFTALMDEAFGEGATYDLRIRPVGAARIF